MDTTIINPAVEAYLDDLYGTPSDPTLAEMESLASQTRFPIIGPHCGRLLYLLARVVRARAVFEMGSGFGYSAVWFARALDPDARLICTDRDPEKKRLAMDFFHRANLSVSPDYRVGDALEILRAEAGPFDIIFVDVDKEEYPDTVGVAVERLRPGGLFITDNTLWKASVVAQQLGTDPLAHYVRDFNRRIAQHPALTSVLIPLRDGFTVALKDG